MKGILKIIVFILIFIFSTSNVYATNIYYNIGALDENSNDDYPSNPPAPPNWYPPNWYPPSWFPPAPIPPPPPSPRNPIIVLTAPTQYVQMAPGVPQYVNVTLRNITHNIANNVNIHLTPNPNFNVQVVSNPSPFAIGNAPRTFTLRITPSNDIDPGNYNISFDISYQNNLQNVSFQSFYILSNIATIQNNEARLLITNLTTGVEQINAGDDFTLNATIRNTSNLPANNVQVSISGLPSPSRILLQGDSTVFIGNIASGGENNLTFNLSSENSIPTGSYPISLILRYQSGNDIREVTQTFYITIIGESDENLGILSVVSLTRPTGLFAPNSEAFIEITIRNDGAVPAQNIRVQATPENGIVSRMASIQTIQNLGVGEVVTLPFAFAPTSQSISQFYNIGFEVSHGLSDNRETFEQFTGFAVYNPSADDNNGNISVPRIIISNYTISPLIVMANSEFDLYLTLQNTHANRSVGNIRVTWEVQGITVGNEVTGGASFTPVGMSNTFFVDNIAQRGEITQHLRLFAIPDAAARNHVISISFEYEDADGNPFTATENIGVNVRQVSRLELGQIMIPEFMEVNQTLQQSFTVFNTGRSTLHNLRVRIEGESINATDGDIIFGNLDGGDHEWFFGSFVPIESGPTEIRVLATFEDDMGEPHEILQTFPTFINDPFENMLDDDIIWDNGDFFFENGTINNGTNNIFTNVWFYIVTVIGALVVALAILFVKKRKYPSFLTDDIDDMPAIATTKEDTINTQSSLPISDKNRYDKSISADEEAISNLTVANENKDIDK